MLKVKQVIQFQKMLPLNPSLCALVHLHGGVPCSGGVWRLPGRVHCCHSVAGGGGRGGGHGAVDQLLPQLTQRGAAHGRAPPALPGGCGNGGGGGSSCSGGGSGRSPCKADSLIVVLQWIVPGQ